MSKTLLEMAPAHQYYSQAKEGVPKIKHFMWSMSNVLQKLSQVDENFEKKYFDV